MLHYVMNHNIMQRLTVIAYDGRLLLLLYPVLSSGCVIHLSRRTSHMSLPSSVFCFLFI